MSHVHVVYTHPGNRGFTREILDAFLGGLEEAGHTYTVSDLYVMGFRSELTAAEYERESGYRADAPVPDDVAAEQARLDAADAWVFVYPVWWADCPARLKGWFDRVWTVGFAYKGPGARVVDKALVLCTAGYSIAELEASGCYQAMKTVMLTDRIGQRARSSEFVVFGGSVPGKDANGAERWTVERDRHLAHAAALARSI
ncbi:NAD(P)H-dependent oxidoreductase [Actinospica durhamensis]|uniref:NAD(P)H-dependent oxidoreductase n=1 Tax=Actinospica durhamensis TaxID=1508375 RepID=A0A941ILL4_9ACTN|nr:NAD(P)H-dependent oxidoreductase [Actinospica durhamensis]MBR7831854.1 NAD(P)H-dependent oxidoreductase [Actinospica durhamensis]